MELKLTPRASIPSLPAAPAAVKTDAAAAAPARAQSRQDRIELSRSAVDYVNSQSAAGEGQEPAALTPDQQREKKKSVQRQAAQQVLQAMRDQSQQMKDSSNQQAEAMSKALDQMKKCSKIAARLQKGGRIPPEDEQYLLEHDPKLYMMAMLMRMMEQNKDNKKYESVLDEEDLQDGQDNSSESAEASAVDGAAEVSAE